MTIKRGGIYLASLGPVVGHEIAKTRPVIVVSNDTGNQYAGTVTVIPLTSKNLSRVYPFEVMIPLTGTSLSKDSKAKADQIRTLDKRRLIKHVGMLATGTMSALDDAIKVHLSLK